jgi:capsular exopolysaccharide synthesis family protein
MERIKQALERAREERERGGVYKSRRVWSSSAPDLSIDFTETRKLQLAPVIIDQKRLAAAAEDGATADAYRILRTRVLQRMRGNGWRSLAVTSMTEHNGKTLTAVNLAISMAKEVNHTVLLVDLDLRRPTVGRCFSNEPAPGLSDHLLRGVPLNQILFNPGIDRLVVLPGNEPLANSSEMLSSPAMATLIQDLKTRYESRYIVFDMPTLLATDDVLTFLPQTDGVLLVIEEGQTLRQDLARVPDLLHGTNLIGTVLNKSADPVYKYS